MFTISQTLLQPSKPPLLAPLPLYLRHLSLSYFTTLECSLNVLSGKEPPRIYNMVKLLTFIISLYLVVILITFNLGDLNFKVGIELLVSSFSWPNIFQIIRFITLLLRKFPLTSVYAALFEQIGNVGHNFMILDD